MENLSKLLESLPDEAKDLRVNAERVLACQESLDSTRTWGVALAAAHFIGHAELTAAVRADAEAAGVGGDALRDARAAAAIMGMNTVYYRFRHLMKSSAYEKMSVNLRMTRMQQVATDKVSFELFSIGPAALAGCELCLKAHESAVKHGGLSESHVHDAVRIASVLQGLAVALGL